MWPGRRLVNSACSETNLVITPVQLPRGPPRLVFTTTRHIGKVRAAHTVTIGACRTPCQCLDCVGDASSPRPGNLHDRHTAALNMFATFHFVQFSTDCSAVHLQNEELLYDALSACGSDKFSSKQIEEAAAHPERGLVKCLCKRRFCRGLTV